MHVAYRQTLSLISSGADMLEEGVRPRSKIVNEVFSIEYQAIEKTLPIGLLKCCSACWDLFANKEAFDYAQARVQELSSVFLFRLGTR